MNDAWMTVYQDLLELEKRKIDEDGLGDPPDPETFITEQEIVDRCDAHGVNTKDFLSSNLLVQYPSFGYRTMHFDLVYRIIHIRNLERQAPIPLEYRIELQLEPVPDFGRHKFSEIIPKIIRNEAVQAIILSTISKSKYEGLSSHQLPIVKELLSEEGRYKTAAIVAPTASGKTLAFFIPVIVKAVERILNKKEGVSSILIYPRKALERDQLQSFVLIIDALNQELKGRSITVGIDDGDTKRLGKITLNEPYREMKCIECGNALIIEKAENKTTVKCSRCRKRYPYIFASKDEIWQREPTILITNVHTIYRRLITPKSVNMFSGIDYAVFDEAHVYTDYLGGHVFYVIGLLRHVASLRGTKPYLVFSSATIPNPLEFTAMLANIDLNELFYVDYVESLAKSPETGRRLMLYLYLLPHPDLSVETLTEALVLAVDLWCHGHKMKAITFVDSVAEISTLSDYIHTTILERRQGREVTDHLFNTTNAPENSYNWFPLAPLDRAVDFDTFRRFVLSEYKRSIDMHYGQLSLPQRARVEHEFWQGILRLLLSTSTLELGIDLSDVAVIIQHKLPITPEGVVQRVGRSGRSPTCFRVALGIIALQSSPLSTLYMFDERLRGRLADVSLLPPARVGQASASIKTQHALTLLLYKRAIEGKPTHIAGEEYLRSKGAVLKAVGEVVNDLNDDLISFNNIVKLFEEVDLRGRITELKTLLGSTVEGLTETARQYYPQIRDKWNRTLAEIENKANVMRQVVHDIDELEDKFKQIEGATQAMIDELVSLRHRLRKAYSISSMLLSVAKSTYRAGESGALQRWYQANLEDINNVSENVPDSDQMLGKLLTPLLAIVKKDFKVFRRKYGFGFDEVTRTITTITTAFGSTEQDGLAAFLNALPETSRFLKSVNIQGLTTFEAMKRIENEIRIKPWGIDIVDAINLLLLNRMRFSLMLEPPSPELELAGVDEA